MINYIHIPPMGRIYRDAACVIKLMFLRGDSAGVLGSKALLERVLKGVFLL